MKHHTLRACLHAVVLGLALAVASTQAATLTTLVEFMGNTAPKGSIPYGSLVQGTDGNLYGMTQTGGSNDMGTIFKMTSAGALTTLVEFNGTNAPKGANPYGSLVQGTDGNFYGMTYGGGAPGSGTAFKMTPAGVLTTLVEFNRFSAPKGRRPQGSLVLGTNGNFYGLTQFGGDGIDVGTAFMMTPAGVVTTLVEFNNVNGHRPQGSLVLGPDGNFYGMSYGAGANGRGTVFKMTHAGVLTTLVSFNGDTAPLGSYPRGSLVLGTDGNFYGMTELGGANDFGTVFKMTPAGVLTTLVEFNDDVAPVGANPWGNLVQGTNGNFYGMTSGGGNLAGMIFQMTPAGALTTLVVFGHDDVPMGSYPRGSLVQSTNGHFYGLTSEGGAVTGAGTAFKLDITPVTEIAVQQPAGTGIPDGGSKAFGSANVGATSNITFTITNSGGGSLTGLGITIDGTDAGMFTVTASPTAPVAAAGSTTFTVRFAPTSAGAKTAALHIANNDSDENPYDITLTGTGVATAPEIGVEQPVGTVIADGGSRAFGSVNAGTTSNITFTITNSGNGSLTGLVVTLDGPDAARFSVIPPAQTVAAGGSTTFVLRFSPLSAGAHSAALHIANNDSDENPYDISLTGTGLAPVMDVQQPVGTSLASGTTKSFGTVTVGATTSLTFTVTNSGNGDLILSTPVMNGSQFTLTTAPAVLVTPGGSTTFTVSFTPTSTGTKMERMDIYNQAGLLQVWLSGTGAGPEMDVQQPVGTSIAGGESLDFGSVNVGANTNITFTITNSGNMSLTGLAITVDGPDADMFSITTNPAVTVAASGSTTFTVRFTPTRAWDVNATLHIANNDGDENPYDIYLTGIGVAPQIYVDESWNFDAVIVGTNASHEFEIWNEGNADLTGLGIMIDGPDAAMFTITASPTAPVPGDDFTPFTVRFTPTGLGVKTATLHITSNDPYLNPADVVLSGIGVTAPPPVTLTTLVEFNGNTAPKGAEPLGSLVQGADGNFYGMTWFGGANSRGTVFKMTPAGVLTTLVDFNGNTAPKGANPSGSLVQGTDGNFYGMTQGGGSNNLGTAFRMTSAGVLTTLVEFKGSTAPKGANPNGSLRQGADGNFYGMTASGGSNDLGTVFKMTPGGVLTTLVEFNGSTAPLGASPRGGLVQGTDGDFYGTTYGGVNNYGTVFKMTPAGVLTTLVEFNDGVAPAGSYPGGSLVQGTDGNFYGMTLTGGATSSHGTVFKMTAAGVLTTLVEFKDDFYPYGSRPNGSLVQGADGNFYGMTSDDGRFSSGTVFQMTPTGVYAPLVLFKNNTAPKGHRPWGSLVQGTDGSFYGMTSQGGSNNYGTVFKMAVGSAGAPEIAVQQPRGTGIADGGGKSFGSVAVGASASFTFTITNSGTASLTGLGITIDGANAARFTVTTNPASALATNGSTTFTVRFAPTAPGTNTAVLHIASNDADENPYDITLTGTGAPAASTTSYTSGVFSQSVPTTVGWSYALEYRNTLSAPWTALPAVVGMGGPVVLSDTGAPLSGRYYRLRATVGP